MSSLRSALDDYLTIRRSLGFKLERNGRLLPQFIDFLERAGAHTIRTDLALAWAKRPANGHPRWWAERMSLVRGFARHVQAFDPCTEVPPRDLLPGCKRRAIPYLYSDAEVMALMEAARVVRSPLRAATYETLIGLLAVTGMRVGEAIRLDRDDLDCANGVLLVRDSKFGKSREVPLHSSTLKALETYARVRDDRCPAPKTTALFVTAMGTRLVYKNFHPVFQRLVRRAGLQRRSPLCRPRPHDLRHTFAVRTLLGWYRAGIEVEGRLPWLSTYLGHFDPAATYWYLSAAPELLALAGMRLERALGPLP
jgi:integrase/recombinase XerD